MKEWTRRRKRRIILIVVATIFLLVYLAMKDRPDKPAPARSLDSLNKSP